jgi:hypothetical protein
MRVSLPDISDLASIFSHAQDFSALQRAATNMSTSLSPPNEADNCTLWVEDSGGNVVPFDIQSAEPGAFTMPGAGDIETYEPGKMARVTWIYFKGNPQKKPEPEHPFERPFKDLAIFSIDLVRDDDASKVLREVMREFSLIC